MQNLNMSIVRSPLNNVLKTFVFRLTQRLKHSNIPCPSYYKKNKPISKLLLLALEQRRIQGGGAAPLATHWVF